MSCLANGKELCKDGLQLQWRGDNPYLVACPICRPEAPVVRKVLRGKRMVEEPTGEAISVAAALAYQPWRRLEPTPVVPAEKKAAQSEQGRLFPAVAGSKENYF